MDEAHPIAAARHIELNPVRVRPGEIRANTLGAAPLLIWQVKTMIS
jgi:hypothetical protein